MLRELMDEMAAVVRTACDATDVDVQVEPRLVVNPSVPTVDIYPGDPFRDDETAGFEDLSGLLVFTVRARVSTSDTDAGQDLLLAFMDDDDELCLQANLQDDQTLNGWATQVVVDGNTGYRMYQDVSGSGAYLGCEWRARVIKAES